MEKDHKEDHDIDRQVDSIGRDLGLGGRAASEAALINTNRDFGKELCPFAVAAADTVGACPEPFRTLPCTEDTIREQEARLRRLLRSKEKVERLGRRINDEQNTLRVDLARNVTLVLQASDATLAHPGHSELKEKLDSAAQPLFALRDGRRASMTAAHASTRALNLQIDGERQADADRIAALETELGEVRLENQLLSGQALRPTDLRRPATPPAAARAGRRTPRRRTPR